MLLEEVQTLNGVMLTYQLADGSTIERSIDIDSTDISLSKMNVMSANLTLLSTLSRLERLDLEKEDIDEKVSLLYKESRIDIRSFKMSNLSLKEKTLLGIAIGVLLGSTLMILSDNITIFDPPEGVDLSKTIFSSLGESDTFPHFDMENMTVYYPSYYVDSNLWNQPLVSHAEAQHAVIKFLRRNLDESWIENITIWRALVGRQPTWAFIITGPYVSTQVRVNAITGEIIGWNLSRSSSSSAERVSVNSTADVEAIAYDFLKENNYSIPSLARYMGVNQYLSDPSNFYVEFRHYEGPFRVGRQFFDKNINPDYTSEGITIRISKTTGIVTQLGFRWTTVGNIPIFNVKTQTYAESVAVRDSSATNLTVLTSWLSLIPIESHPSQDGSPQLHLSWIMACNVSNKLWWAYVDAFSGELLEEWGTNGPIDVSLENHETQPISYLIIPAALAISSLVAIVVSIIQKRRIYQG
jgi:hypothetical protein